MILPPMAAAPLFGAAICFCFARRLEVSVRDALKWGLRTETASARRGK